jgi:hypothetical protein
MGHNRRNTLLVALLIVIGAGSSCTAAQAIKVQCDSNLRPINPSSLEHPQP